jgi:ABC-type transport system involved in multi-copper enzyme maturation permease subunit
VQERKDKVLLFVLSLPVSTAQYVRAKVLANAIAFTVPWLVLTAAGVGVVMASPIPDGLIPFWVTVLVYLLAYYFVLLAVAISTDASGWHATAITIGNVSVNLLIPYLLRLPSVVAHHNAPRPVWTADILAINGIEIVVGVAALALALRLRSRRTDHV